MGDLLASLGNISPNRVRMKPAPGTATERDVVRIREKTRRIYELVDGTLVEKTMGYHESTLAMRLAFFIQQWNLSNGEPGSLAGEAGTLKLMDKLVRSPDISFIRYERLPDRTIPNDAVPNLAPDLAVEVLSEGNTREEMERKLKEYFLSDVTLVWYINTQKRIVQVYTSPDSLTELTENDTLDGGTVLPGFTLPIATLFDKLPKDKKAKKTSKNKKPKKRN
jgi:Uma2 family endonuclease